MPFFFKLMSVDNVLTPYDTVIYRLDLYLIMSMSFPVFCIISCLPLQGIECLTTYTKAFQAY